MESPGFTSPIHERYFEDYYPGLIDTFGSELVSEDAIVQFARDFDPQFIHTDPIRATDGPFGGLIASGWHTAAIMMRIFAKHFLNDLASLASPGVDELRWIAPVRPNDVLTAQFEVVSKRVSRSKPDRGIVVTKVTMTKGSGEIVLTLTATNILRRRPSEPTSG